MAKKEVDQASIPKGNGDKESTTIEFESVEAVTEKAALFVVDGEKQWVPRSQIHDIEEDSMEVSTWLAEEKGWL